MNPDELLNGAHPHTEGVAAPDAASIPDESRFAESSFEERVRELESIVRRLESGGVALEESLRLLSRGMSLARACDATLAGAEAVLEQLVATNDGELTTTPLDWED